MARGTSLAVPALANPLSATIAPSGIWEAASSALITGKFPACILIPWQCPMSLRRVSLSLDDLASNAHDHLFYRNVLPGFLHTFSNDNRHGRTARYFHIDYRNAVDVGSAEDLGEFVCVFFCVVKFGTAEKNRLPPDEL